MPNHIPCILTISGNGGTIADLIEFVKGPGAVFKESPVEAECRIRHNLATGKPADFVPPPEASAFECHKIIPVPPDVLAQPYGDGPSVGYNWCVKNWGTKWGAYEVQAAHTESGDNAFLCYTFMCAWEPCLPVIEALVQKYPTLTFEFRWVDVYDDSKHTRKWEPQEVKTNG